MKYMVHSCNARKSYVEYSLVPSMVKEGIDSRDIIVYNDNDESGCLQAFIASCRCIVDNQWLEGMWHLQDDVVICKGFAKRTANPPKDIIVNGFVCKEHNPDRYRLVGNQPIRNHWLSFQCQYIPFKYINGFLEWMDQTIKKGNYERLYRDNRHADFFFWKSAINRFPNDSVINMAPNLVDHIDYLLGGSIITPNKKHARKAYYWNEQIREITWEGKE